MYCICMSISSLSAAQSSVSYICFLQPLLGLPVAHIELILHVYEYMPFTDLISASSMYILGFQGMPPLRFLGHTNYLY